MKLVAAELGTRLGTRIHELRVILSHVLKNVTITADKNTLQWARKEAASKGLSVSKWIGQLLERERRRTDDYWVAYEDWKKMKPVKMARPISSISRDETYDRGR